MAGLARVSERAGGLERALMSEVRRPNSRMPESEALGEELVAIARQARRR